MKSFKQYIAEILENPFERAVIAHTAALSIKQLEKHRDLLKNLGVRPNDPRISAVDQQIKNRFSLAGRLNKK